MAGRGHIVAVHVKDTRPGVFKNVPFGDRAWWISNGASKRCWQSGYRGPYLIEMWSEKANDPLRAVREARAWVVERMVEAGLEIRR